MATPARDLQGADTAVAARQGRRRSGRSRTAADHARPPVATAPRKTRTVAAARSRVAGSRAARYVTPVLVALTLGLVLVGGLVAVRMVTGSAGAGADSGDGRVPTSFGALWVDSFREVTVPQMVKQGHLGMPVTGAPDKVSFEVVVRLANTTGKPVELTPAAFGLRSAAADEPISVEGATFESIRLLPGALFDGRLQFPVEDIGGGEHRLSLLFDDPDGSSPIVIDLGRTRLSQPSGEDKGQHH